MFFEGSSPIKYLRKKYTKEKLIIFTGSKNKSVKRYKRLIAKSLKILSHDLNYDLYIFNSEHDKSLLRYGNVFYYDKTCIKEAMYKVQDLVDAGCERAFILNTDIPDKRLFDERLRYRFLFLTTISDIYLPEAQPNRKIKIGGADIFNIVRDVEALQTEKICYCNKECLREFKENEYKYPENIVYFRMNKKDSDKHIKIVDAILE